MQKGVSTLSDGNTKFYRAMAQAISRQSHTAKGRVQSEAKCMGFVMDQVALEQIFP
jgi:hypothetical protein